MTNVINSPYRLGLPLQTNPTKIEKKILPLQELAYDTLLTFSHGIVDSSGNAILPDLFDVVLVCKVADNGYSVGDELNVIDTDGGSTSDHGMTAAQDASNVEIAFGNIWGVINQSTFNRATLTATSWDIKVTVYKFTIGDIPDITRVGFVTLEPVRINNGDTEAVINLEQYFNEYDGFTLEFDGVYNATDNTAVYMTASDDGGDTYESANYNLQSSGVSGGSAADAEAQGTAQWSVGNSGTNGVLERLRAVFNTRVAPEGETTVIQGTAVRRTSGGTDQCYIYGMWCSNITTRVTHLKVAASSGNLAGGTIHIYGKRKVA